MTIEDTAQFNARAVQPTENRFARVPLGDVCSKLKPCLFKTLSSICGLSFEDQTGARFTRATNIELARQAHCHAKRIGAGLVELESAGLVTTHQAGRVRTITLSSNPEYWKFWCTIELDCPVWKEHARAFKVFAGLRKFKGRNHEAFMTNPTLAKFLNMNLSSVKRGFMELDDAGLVQSLTRWDGTRRQRRVVFPIVRTYPKSPPLIDEGQNSPLEDSATGHEGQNSPLEDSKGNGRKTGAVKGQNSPSLRDKTAPHYGTKQPLTEGQNSPLEDSFKRTLNKPTNTHPAHAGGQGAGPQTPAGVCQSGSDRSPGQEIQSQDQSQSPLDVMYGRLRIENKLLSGIELIQAKRAIAALWKDFGPIPAGFLQDCLTTGIDENTLKRAKVIIENVNHWRTYTDQERAGFKDETVWERLGNKDRDQKAESPNIRSKFNGAERVKSPDGQWRDKALPAENGSGTPATEVLARMGLRPESTDITPAPVEPPVKAPMTLEKEIEKLNRRKEKDLKSHDDKVTSEIQKALAIYQQGECLKMKDDKDLHRKIDNVRQSVNRIKPELEKNIRSKRLEEREAIIAKYDREVLTIRAKYQPAESEPQEPETNRAETGLDLIPAGSVV